MIKMVKKAFVLFFTLFLFILIPLSISAEESITTLKIHYFRYNGDYSDGWDLWVWQKAPVDGAGASYSFDRVNNEIVIDDFGAVATIDLTNSSLKGATKIGIIIRKGDSWVKDVSTDRFIDIKETNETGVIDRYFVEGDKRIGSSSNDPLGPDRTDKIRFAYFKNESEIAFSLTAKLKSNDISLIVDGEIFNSTIEVEGTNGLVTINEKLDFSKSYILSANFSKGQKTYQITYDGIYDSDAFNEAFGYEGNDLGATINNGKTTFRLWAPISSRVVLNIYSTGTPLSLGGSNTKEEIIEMKKDVKGTWVYEVNESLHGKYYTYSVTNGLITNEVVDPYAKSAGVNGVRGLIVDFSKTNPKGFKYNNRPNNISNATDSIIYELHVRDLTSHSSWNGNEEYRGKLLGLTVEGTTYENVTTGLDHIKELGVTHLQLLPFFDHGVINEADPNAAFNWGYMPLNFNVIEGSYSTNPFDGLVRISELKQVTNTLTKNNIGLIMDVVYNHTGQSADSNFNLIVPGYYYRMNSDGSFSNGSGCGNETASERYMMQKFILDSVIFWATEYNISGFRFDLMGLHDTETMNLVATKLHEIDKNILVYGEPWNGGASLVDTSVAADKTNLSDLNNVAAFNDEIRDGIKGSVFSTTEKGFIQGNIEDSILNKVKYGVVGGVEHYQVDKSFLSNSEFWSASPIRTINYVSAHDNNTLYDKIVLSTSSKQKDLRDDMQKQANAIVMTSQGIVFLHAGVDFMRSKPNGEGGYDSNSYASSDETNQLRWDLKAKADNLSCFNYYKGLIALRKAHPAFRMTEASDVIKNVKFIYEDNPNIIAYTISNFANNDSFGTILVINANCNKQLTTLTLPSGEWNLVANGTKVSLESFKTYTDGSTINIFANETLILYQGYQVPKKTGCNSASYINIINTLSCLFLISLVSYKKKQFYIL